MKIEKQLTKKNITQFVKKLSRKLQEEKSSLRQHLTDEVDRNQSPSFLQTIFEPTKTFAHNADDSMIANTACHNLSQQHRWIRFETYKWSHPIDLSATPNDEENPLDPYVNLAKDAIHHWQDMMIIKGILVENCVGENRDNIENFSTNNFITMPDSTEEHFFYIFKNSY